MYMYLNRNWISSFLWQNLLDFLLKFFVYSKGNISKAIVGVAHHVSFMRPYGLFDVAAVTLANSLTLFPFIDSISNKLDFIGMNYYGQVYTSKHSFPRGKR